MDTTALVNQAKTKIEEAQGIIAKFSRDLLDNPDTALRFSRPAFEAAAQLTTWKTVLSHLNAGTTVEALVELLHDDVLRLAAVGTTAATAAETALNLENLRHVSAAYKKLQMYAEHGNLALL
jgi:hypothetical protein